MNQPQLNEMLIRTKNKYSLVIVAAKRARQITEAGNELIEDKATKPVTVALYEIAEGEKLGSEMSEAIDILK